LETAPGTIGPLAHSGPSTTWAPGDMTVVGNTLLFVGLRGAAIYSAQIQRDASGEISLSEVREHFKDEFGRIRTIAQGPEGRLYILTSNRDGRGDPPENKETKHNFFFPSPVPMTIQAENQEEAVKIYEKKVKSK